MTKINVPHLTNRPRKDGTKRYYWQPSRALGRAGWKLTPLGDDEFTAITRAREINQQVDEWRIDQSQIPSTHTRGTINDLIEKYKNSRDFTHNAEGKKKTDKTINDYTTYLKIISEWAGDKQATAINKKMVSNLYEIIAQKKPRKASYIITVLRAMFSYAERQSIIPPNSNPATNMRITTKTKKGQIWTPEDVEIFARAADEYGAYSLATAVILNEWMGQRMGDIITIRTCAYKDGEIVIKQSKTGAMVTLPVDTIPHLKARLDEQLRRKSKRRVTSPYIIEQENGRPFTVDGFSKLFAKIRTHAAKSMQSVEAEKFKQLKFMTLRHTAVTRLAEAGCEIPEIASISGHTFQSCQAIIDRYNTRTKTMAQNAFSKRNQKHKEN